MMFLRVLRLWVALVLVLPVMGLGREWTQDGTGKTVEAEFVKASKGVVTLRLPTGREARIPMSALVAEDRAYISQLTAVDDAGGEGAWPHWRGPDRNGIANNAGLKKNWKRDGAPIRRWVYQNAGLGYSGMSTGKGWLYSMGTRGTDLVVFGVDTKTGDGVWSTKVAEDLPDEIGYNVGWGRGPRSTPSYSAGMLYALTPLGQLVALEAESGELVWSKDLMVEFDARRPAWGYSESPLVDGEQVVVTPGGTLSPGGSMVAFNKWDGRVIWHAQELTDSQDDNAHYATITPAEINGVRQYVQLFQNSLVGVAAETGERLWRADWPKGRTAVVPTPIVEGNKVYVTSGYGAGAMLVEVMPNWNTRVLWQNTVMKNHHGGVVKMGNYVYGFSDAAGLICQDFSSGKMTWNQKSEFFQKGSIVGADGLLYTLNESDGTISLVVPDPGKYVARGHFKLQPQSENRHANGGIWTHPIIAGGCLYVRDQEYIVCYDLRN